MTKCLPFSSFNFVTVGFPESYDIKNATLGARVLGVNNHKCYLSKELISDTITSLKHLKVIHNPIHLTVAIPLYLGIKTISERCQAKTVFMGQGADRTCWGGLCQLWVLLIRALKDSSCRSIINWRSSTDKRLLRLATT